MDDTDLVKAGTIIFVEARGREFCGSMSGMLKDFLGIRDPIPDTDELVIVAANVVTGANFTVMEATSGPAAPMAFALYTSPTPGSGTLRWDESRTVHDGTDGQVHVMLGVVEPIPGNIFIPGIPLYLEVAVNGDAMNERVAVMIPGRLLILEAVSGRLNTDPPDTGVEDLPPMIFSAHPARGGAAVMGRGPRAGRVAVFEDAATTGTQWTAARQSELMGDWRRRRKSSLNCARAWDSLNQCRPAKKIISGADTVWQAEHSIGLFHAERCSGAARLRSPQEGAQSTSG